MVLSYNLLKGAIQTATEGCFEWNWSLKNIKGYLSVYGMSNDITLLIISCCGQVCIQMIHEWMKRQGKCSSLIMYRAGALESVEKLRLSWCNIPFNQSRP